MKTLNALRVFCSIAFITLCLNVSFATTDHFTGTHSDKDHLIVIDSSLSNANDIARSASSNAHVLWLDGSSDAITQITRALARKVDIESLHIVAHGSSGRLAFENSELSLATLGAYRDSIVRWRDALAEDATIALYGCDVAAGEGVEFIEAMSVLTGAHVSASTDATGHEARGGDWHLEASTGGVGAPSVFEPLIEDVDILLDLPNGFIDELVLDNLDQAVAAAFLPSGEMLVIQRAGKIFITDPLARNPSKTLYMTIPNVDRGGEKGLLNIALDPDFASNDYFYVYYHHAPTDRARISRFEHKGNRADPGDEMLIWEDHIVTSYQDISDHWGGGLSFGPDDNLYLTIGDKKDRPNEAQDINKSAGKIIRVNPRGAETGGPWRRGGNNSHLIPNDNPFVGRSGLDEVWGLGLRNPFRAIWDLTTERLFISEVGGNVQSGPNASYEDLHVATPDSAGVNFGWPSCEGPRCAGSPPSNYSPPLFTIQHKDSRVLIVGAIYRGNRFPAQYRNALFMTDFGKGWLRYITFKNNGDVANNVPAGGFKLSDNGDLGKPVYLAAGPDGALYYIDLVGRNDNGSGELRRITFETDDLPPVITQSSADVTGGGAPLTVNFEGEATDPQGGNLTYRWEFGDGDEATGENVTHIYRQTGTYQAVLRVSNEFGTTTAPSITIVVGAPPDVSIVTPANGLSFRADDLIRMRATAEDDGPNLRNRDLRWTIGFGHDDHVHPVVTDKAGTRCSPGRSSCFEFRIPKEGHDFADDTSFIITFTATDRDGLEASDSITIFPEKVNVTFNSNVPGDVTYFLDQVPRGGPFVLDTLVGFEHEIEAPETANGGGSTYAFEQWSNGPSSAKQTITVPASDATFSAQYRDTSDPPSDNNPPTITLSRTSVTVLEGNTTSVDVSSTDSDGDNLILSLSSNAPSGMVSLDDDGNGSGTLLIAPQAGDAGDYSATVTVTDDGSPSLGDSKTLDIDVNERSDDGTRVTQGLLLLYTFDSGSGDVVFDKSGVAPPLDLVVDDPGAVSWGGDGTLSVDSPTAIRSPGPAEKLNSQLPVASELTVEFWITPAREVRAQRIFSVSKNGARRNLSVDQDGGGSAPGSRYLMRLRTSKTGNNGSKPVFRSPKRSAVAGALQHVVITREVNGTARIYVDGVERAKRKITGQLINRWNPSYELVLANEITGRRPFLGRYFLVAVYERALTQAEVTQNFDAGPDGENSSD